MMKGSDNLYIPLGRNVVFTFKNNRACLQYIKANDRRYILFNERAWNRYMNYAHSKIMHYIRNSRKRKRCQCIVANACNKSFGHPEIIPHFTPSDRKERRRRRGGKVFFRQTVDDDLASNEGENTAVFQDWENSSDWDNSHTKDSAENAYPYSLDDDTEMEQTNSYN